MTKYEGYAVCDICGRIANRRKPNDKFDGDNISFLEKLGLLGITGMAIIGAKRIDSEKSRPVSKDKTFRDAFKNFLRNTMYSIITLLYICIGLGILTYGVEKQNLSVMNSFLLAVSGVMIIWGAILIAVIKGDERLTFWNIVGSVTANIICKIIGFFVIFSEAGFMCEINMLLRVVAGVYLLIKSRRVYMAIKDF